MRVFIPVFFNAPLGGLHSHVRSQCIALARAGHTPVVMCKPGPFSKILQSDGVSVVEADFLDISSATTKALASGPFNLVHAHPFFSRAVGLNVSKASKIPFVVTFHGPYLDELPTWHEDVDLVIAVSTTARDEIVAKTPISPSKVVVIPNGVNANIYNRRAGLVDDSHSVDLKHKERDPKPQVVFASRFDKDKRFIIDTILETWRICIREKATSVDWLIAGDGTFRDEMEAVAANLNAASGREAVAFLGWLQDTPLATLYARADLCIGPGRCAIDAMACGTPVIALGSRGYVGLIDERRITSGIYSNFGGFGTGHSEYVTGSLFSDIQSVIYDRERLQFLGATSALVAQAFFLQERLDEQLLALYDAIKRIPPREVTVERVEVAHPSHLLKEPSA